MEGIMLEQIIQLILENGSGVVLMAYFLFKDYKFNGNITNVLGEIKEVLAVMKDHMGKGGSEE
jgi:hypothetical protein